MFFGCQIVFTLLIWRGCFLFGIDTTNQQHFAHCTGIALDGHLKDEDVNLASSTLVADGKSPTDAVGIVISYSLRIKVNCGTLGGELITDVPFKLMQPAPGKKPQPNRVNARNNNRLQLRNVCNRNR